MNCPACPENIVAAREVPPCAPGRASLPSHGHYIPPGLLLQWHLTDRCNLRCTHCYQDRFAGPELDLAGLKAVLRQYEELLDSWRSIAPGPRPWGQVTVTGGEPLVRADCFDLLELLAARRDQFGFAVLTNGHLIDARSARRLRDLGPAFVQVSLEGSRPTHDRIRGAGSHARVVAAIRLLRREGVRVLISFTAQRANYRQFPEVARLGRRLGVQRVWADRLIPAGGTDDHPRGAGGPRDGAQTLSPGETREFVELMRSTRKRSWRTLFSRTEIAMHRGLQFLGGGGYPYHCVAGNSLLTVMPNGDVYPCRRLPIRVGNVFETPLLELYCHSSWLRRLRDPEKYPGECAGCGFKWTCRGGLRCLAHAVNGDPFRADPGCWLAHGQ